MKLRPLKKNKFGTPEMIEWEFMSDKVPPTKKQFQKFIGNFTPTFPYRVGEIIDTPQGKVKIVAVSKPSKSKR